MKALKTKLIMVFVLCFVLQSYSQNTDNTTEKSSGYSNAVGLRVGETSGLTVKHFFDSDKAVEGIVGVWPYALGLTGLFEKYVPVKPVDGLSLYLGGGAHFTFGGGRPYPYYVYYNNEGRYYYYRYSYPGIGVGIDGVIGAEYRVPKTPLAFSLDVKPFFEINNVGIIYTALDPSVGIKIIIK